jgi:uncharacterized protein (TIGR03083 family)
MAEYDPCDVRHHVDRLEREGGLLAAAAATAGLGAAVPPCPGWQVRDVLAHTGFVHRWAAGFVAGGRTGPVDTPGEPELLRLAPADSELPAWFAEGHAALVSALRAAPADLACWSFLPAPSPLAFWARRQAHETAIHRVDAEQAAGAGVSPLPPSFAADGIDELLTGFLARNMRRGHWQAGPGRLGIHARDGQAQADWLVTSGPGESSVSRGAGPADCDVTGPAAGLYLALWNRGPVAGLTVTGDPALLAGLRDRLHVRWS